MHAFRRPSPRILRRACLALVLLLLAACATRQAPQVAARSPADVRAEIVRKLPAGTADREGWATDLYAAMAAQQLPMRSDNICAILAVAGQESNYQVDPVVPDLPRIARAEIDRRAAAKHIPRFLVGAALQLHGPDGRSYAQRLQGVRTEHDLSDMFEDFVGMVPLGKRLFDGYNPVHTAGPMQVSIAFAQAHAQRYPYPVDGSIRNEVFSRRGGLYFGTLHLFGYPADYRALRFRFADYNAGWYASRNAAFQAAVTAATGIRLALDGDLLTPGASLQQAGATERAVRTLEDRLGMDDGAVRRALAQGDAAGFADTDLYRHVFALADAAQRRTLPRAILPGIDLHSPKIRRKLTTAWFADRVQQRWQACMAQR